MVLTANAHGISCVRSLSKCLILVGYGVVQELFECFLFGFEKGRVASCMETCVTMQNLGHLAAVDLGHPISRSTWPWEDSNGASSGQSDWKTFVLTSSFVWRRSILIVRSHNFRQFAVL